MITSVSFTSEARAQRLRANPRASVISITEPWRRDEARLAKGWGAAPLRLKFDDVEQVSQFAPHVHGTTEQPFDQSHAQAILAWLDRHAQHLDHCYCHCWAGVSRSAGVAKFIAQRYGLAFDPLYRSYNRLVYRVLCRTAGLEPLGAALGAESLETITCQGD
jgi:predicted protein tyrosine phosphatase